MHETILARFREAAPPVDYCAMRLVEEQSEELTVRRDVLQPVQVSMDRGVMISVHHRGGAGYAATCDLSRAGLRRAAARASAWAEASAGRSVCDFSAVAMPHPRGEHLGPAELPWQAVPLAHKLALLQDASGRLHPDDRVVDWAASLWNLRSETLLATADGGRAHQLVHVLSPDAYAVAAQDGRVQRRSWGGGRGASQQGGLELLEREDFQAVVERLPRQALELLSAPDCPEGRMQLLLAADQMMLQVHESIGHPLELDRILGDERAYAGTSFVTPDMFGGYRYGSPLLDVTFDPGLPHQLASYGYDDEGSPAERQWLIRGGLLLRPLGGVISQARAGMPGVANARAQSWNRPPIDRMGNINVELGDSSLGELIERVQRGVYMQTNCSWSIDDSRNKFQFGCEYGQLIEDGQLKGVVRDPNYRGISATFWRNLAGLGDASTYGVYGTPWCGKGEPNQVMRVGHASPAGLFDDVAVFGAGS